MSLTDRHSPFQKQGTGTAAVRRSTRKKAPASQVAITDKGTVISDFPFDNANYSEAESAKLIDTTVPETNTSELEEEEPPEQRSIIRENSVFDTQSVNTSDMSAVFGKVGLQEVDSLELFSSSNEIIPDTDLDVTKLAIHCNTGDEKKESRPEEKVQDEENVSVTEEVGSTGVDVKDDASADEVSQPKHEVVDLSLQKKRAEVSGAEHSDTTFDASKEDVNYADDEASQSKGDTTQTIDDDPEKTQIFPETSHSKADTTQTIDDDPEKTQIFPDAVTTDDSDKTQICPDDSSTASRTYSVTFSSPGKKTPAVSNLVLKVNSNKKHLERVEAKLRELYPQAFSDQKLMKQAYVKISHMLQGDAAADSGEVPAKLSPAANEGSDGQPEIPDACDEISQKQVDKASAHDDQKSDDASQKQVHKASAHDDRKSAPELTSDASEVNGGNEVPGKDPKSSPAVVLAEPGDKEVAASPAAELTGDGSQVKNGNQVYDNDDKASPPQVIEEDVGDKVPKTAEDKGPGSVEEKSKQGTTTAAEGLLNGEGPGNPEALNKDDEQQEVTFLGSKPPGESVKNSAQPEVINLTESDSSKSKKRPADAESAAPTKKVKRIKEYMDSDMVMEKALVEHFLDFSDPSKGYEIGM